MKSKTRLGSLYPQDFRIKLSSKKTITKEEYSNGNKCEKRGTECKKLWEIVRQYMDTIIYEINL